MVAAEGWVSREAWKVGSLSETEERALVKREDPKQRGGSPRKTKVWTKAQEATPPPWFTLTHGWWQKRGRCVHA